MKRRDTLKLLASVPAAALFTWSVEEASAAGQEAHHAMAQAAAAGQPYTPKFFTAHEYATVIALADMIIPKDARSVSASEAGAPAFIDHLISLQTERQTAIRGGLMWLDTECRERFDKRFLECGDADRRNVLDDIAFPARAAAAHRQGARFFSTMRDLVATGFWSSRIGVADLGYMGNRPFNWDGPPAAVLQKLGLPET
jgi:gluconate 2-dehydrogenase gamma chain